MHWRFILLRPGIGNVAQNRALHIVCHKRSPSSPCLRAVIGQLQAGCARHSEFRVFYFGDSDVHVFECHVFAYSSILGGEEHPPPAFAGDVTKGQVANSAKDGFRADELLNVHIDAKRVGRPL